MVSLLEWTQVMRFWITSRYAITIFIALTFGDKQFVRRAYLLSGHGLCFNFQGIKLALWDFGFMVFFLITFSSELKTPEKLLKHFQNTDTLKSKKALQENREQFAEGLLKKQLWHYLILACFSLCNNSAVTLSSNLQCSFPCVLALYHMNSLAVRWHLSVDFI